MKDKELYNILSWGKDRPEIIPDKNDVMRLLIENSRSEEQINRAEIVDIRVEYANKIGLRYIRVRGWIGEPGCENLAVLTFEHGQNYEIGTVIGDLTVYRSKS